MSGLASSAPADLSVFLSSRLSFLGVPDSLLPPPDADVRSYLDSRTFARAVEYLEDRVVRYLPLEERSILRAGGGGSGDVGVQGIGKDWEGGGITHDKWRENYYAYLGMMGYEGPGRGTGRIEWKSVKFLLLIATREVYLDEFPSPSPPGTQVSEGGPIDLSRLFNASGGLSSLTGHVAEGRREEFPLGFTTNNDRVDQAAVKLKMEYIKGMRELQDR